MPEAQTESQLVVSAPAMEPSVSHELAQKRSEAKTQFAPLPTSALQSTVIREEQPAEVAAAASTDEQPSVSAAPTTAAGAAETSARVFHSQADTFVAHAERQTMTAMQITSMLGMHRIHANANAPIPRLADHDVLIEVYAAGINPIDWKMLDGDLPVVRGSLLPFTLGFDVAGVVSRVGPRASRFKIGDEVLARCDRPGTFAQYCATHEDTVALKPNNLTFESAAAVPLAALTAYQCLVDVAQVTAGQRVLIHAGLGGVGSFAIQIAKTIGCFVATTCSARNMHAAKALGADIVVDYRSQRFRDHLNQFDVVIDSLGGKCLTDSMKCLKPDGLVIEIGGLPTRTILRSLGLRGYHGPREMSLLTASRYSHWKCREAAKKHNVRYEYYFMHPSGEQLQRITRWLADRTIQPVVDRMFEFFHVEDALNYSATGHVSGKIVLQVKSAPSPPARLNSLPPASERLV
ncbi:dehydrogenase [Capsaspora owczarzaki ATCC 30864]|uniref:Dehydrogenase n=1 Tax=Capsaspora owczarzaki (strain ATCC 30864) TaxID=595528 RepID=A0A0D2W019_CAPO3|nr:dehydrogenase [Capsaspora owczarzaki ATCC 30864]KJE97492.1 dehydrogenase [Capsaspora owczarzaki ATCC 30864]|eukprot:XP_004343200.1 dehydrogenase [Capsaspora owczarzaki ATCC 30864]